MKHVTKAERVNAAPESSSWWLDYESFYQQARERFPLDAPDKSSQPVVTYGPYRRSLVATARERVKDQAERGHGTRERRA